MTERSGQTVQVKIRLDLEGPSMVVLSVFRRRDKVKGYFCLFLCKNLYCGCSLESPRQGKGKAILMSTHYIGFYGDLTNLIFSIIIK